MKNFDLEHFPVSERAKRMLSYVSDGFYDESYVGKWLFEVMGTEYDAALKAVLELPAQFFPETATWGLMYHEIKWGLPVRENLPYEERRRLIYQKRDYRAPMTPYHMERYLEEATGFEVHIADINDPGIYGFTAPHPNIFKAYFLGEDTLDSKLVHKILDGLKQSHTSYTVNDRIEIVIDERGLECVCARVRYCLRINFWNARCFDGTYRFDGTVRYDAGRRYGLRVSTGYCTAVKDASWEAHLHTIDYTWKQYLREEETARAVFRFTADFWGVRHFDGRFAFDGGQRFDTSRGRMRASVLHHAGADSSGLEKVVNVMVETKTRERWFFNGVLAFNGKKRYHSVYRKEAIE